MCIRDRAYYLDRAFPLEGGYEIRFSERELRDAVTIYGEALAFASQAAQRFFNQEDAPAELEISIDETILRCV